MAFADPSVYASARSPWMSARRSYFLPSERLVVTMGAVSLGFLVGSCLAIILGRTSPQAISAGLLVAYAFVFALAARSFEEMLGERSWRQAALFALHLLSFGLWPFAVMLFDPMGVQFWTGFWLLVATLTTFLLLTRPTSRAFYRLSAHTALLAALTAFQGVMAAIGA